MAKDDNSDFGTWPLLCDARALVAKYCKSETLAENLILDYERKGRIAHVSYHEQDQHFRGINPRPWGTSAANVYYPVDWENSTVSYVRGEPQDKSNIVLEAVLDEAGYLPPNLVYQIQLVRLCPEHLFAMLRELKLLPPDEEAWSAAAPKPTASNAERVAAGLTSSAPKPVVEKRSTKKWLEYAIEQRRDELIGLKPQTAAKKLALWMKQELYDPQKPVGWHRLKNIGRESDLLPVKATGKRPQSDRESDRKATAVGKRSLSLASNDRKTTEKATAKRPKDNR